MRYRVLSEKLIPICVPESSICIRRAHGNRNRLDRLNGATTFGPKVEPYIHAILFNNDL